MALSAYTDPNKLADATVAPNFWGGLRAKLKLISNTHHAQEVAIAAGETVGVDQGSIYNGATALTPKYAIISATDTGDNTVVAGVANKKIRVISYTLVSAGTVSCTWNSDAVGGTQVAKSGAMPLALNTGVHAAYCPVGHLETVVGKALVLTKSADVDVFGHLTYVEV